LKVDWGTKVKAKVETDYPITDYRSVDPSSAGLNTDYH